VVSVTTSHAAESEGKMTGYTSQTLVYCETQEYNIFSPSAFFPVALTWMAVGISAMEVTSFVDKLVYGNDSPSINSPVTGKGWKGREFWSHS